MKRFLLITAVMLVAIGSVNGQSLSSLGKYVWTTNDEPKTFNNKLQLSFVRSDEGFPQYGTVLAGGGYPTTQDGATFQLFFPYGPTYGGIAPQIRLGKYDNQGWSNWETLYTSANANKSTIDWSANNFIANGNVGIGTTTPSNPLTVQSVSGGNGYGNSDGTGGLRVRWSTGYGVALDAWDGGAPRWGITSYDANTPTIMIEGRCDSKDVIFNSGGNVGIGTTSPAEKLEIKDGNLKFNGLTTTAYGSLGRVDFFNNYSSSKVVAARIEGKRDSYSHKDGRLSFYTADIDGNLNENMTLSRTGNLGIGTTSPSEKLTVKGTILATKVQVLSADNIPDYVFENDYDLRSLEEVENFITKNKHLPEVPSAAEFKENGYSMGEMDNLLLRKVEELTLYIIEQQKTIEAMQIEIKELKN